MIGQPVKNDRKSGGRMIGQRKNDRTEGRMIGQREE
jgi:hypothetical protein